MSELALREEVLELAVREADGISVQLLYKTIGKEVLVHLVDVKEDRDLQFPVSPENAKDAFDHPYAYYQEFLGGVALQAA
jgi:truncated hemoglobin YjbI